MRFQGPGQGLAEVWSRRVKVTGLSGIRRPFKIEELVGVSYLIKTVAPMGPEMRTRPEEVGLVRGNVKERGWVRVGTSYGSGVECGLRCRSN